MMNNKLDKESLKDEMIQTKEDLQKSFDEQLGHIEVTKEELEKLKANLTQYPKYVLEREVKHYHILKKLGVVEKEQGLYDRLDKAINFLNKQLELQANRTKH